jgi:hypothetical protein
MFRSLALIAIAASLTACGGPDLTSRVVIGDDATLTKKGTVWFLSAPVQVTLPPSSAAWRITSDVDEMTSTNFLAPEQDVHELPAGATAFERPLKTVGDLKRGVRVSIRLSVATHVWDGTLDSQTGSESKTFDFMPQ